MNQSISESDRVKEGVSMILLKYVKGRKNIWIGRRSESGSVDRIRGSGSGSERNNIGSTKLLGLSKKRI